jgi:hypothetical protein
MKQAWLPRALLAGLLVSMGLPATARANDFDPKGEYLQDPKAVAFVGFESDPERYVPDNVDGSCQPPAFTLGQADDALESKGFATVNVKQNCAERFTVHLPPVPASYRVTAWVRHGKGGLTFVVNYDPKSGNQLQVATMGPTGRTTSDGWVEMATNEVPVDGATVTVAYLKIANFGGADGTQLDALEVVPAGAFEPQKACQGASDPVCGPESVCVSQRCAMGRLAVPPMPPDALKDGMVDGLAGRVRTFFGGQRSRAEKLPQTLATIESMRKAETAWQFWGRFSLAIRQMEDWHTGLGIPLGGAPQLRLDACFIEGDADLTHAVWPRDPQYADILVSHSGGGPGDLKTGDRLVAVDGQHPLAWARSLRAVNPGYHVATDPNTFADLAEALGGPQFTASLILHFAKQLTLIRCDAAGQKCNDHIENVDVASLNGPGGTWMFCDNRPFYHIDGANPPPDNHAVFGTLFEGKIKDTTDAEAIYGLVWDTLWGGGDPNGGLNGQLKQLMAKWKASARGVILDHRAGNGGTLDSPTLLTSLVRPAKVQAVVLMPVEIAGYGGPADAAEGLALFDAFKAKTPYVVGSDNYDPSLPVALVLHRDGSASDYLPLGMKGAPNVKLFGPHATAGAFSTFVQVAYHGALELQFASGDTVTDEGQAQIGHGVTPDFVVEQKQSDLLAGKDSIHEAALAWVRAHLKEAM